MNGEDIELTVIVRNILTIINHFRGLHFQLLALYWVIALTLMGVSFSDNYKKMRVAAKFALSLAFFIVTVVGYFSTENSLLPLNAAIKGVKSTVHTPEFKSVLTNYERHKKNKRPPDDYIAGEKDIAYITYWEIVSKLNEVPLGGMFLYYFGIAFFALLFIWRDHILAKKTEYPQEAEIISSFAERFIQQGLEQGIPQGKQEGRQEGEATILLRLLQRKFGEVPEAARHRIESADAQTLLAWSERVLTAASIEQVIGE